MKHITKILLTSVIVVILILFSSCSRTESRSTPPSGTGPIIGVTEAPKGELEFILTERNTSYAVKSIGTYTGKDIVIPKEYKGLPVTKIMINAFQNKNISSVYIPSTVTKIFDGAFERCASLESVTFEKGSNLTYIGVSAFAACGRLRTFDFKELSKLEEIDDLAFTDCENLESFDLPQNSVLSKMGESFLSGCTGITRLYIPKDFSDIDIDFLRACRINELDVHPEHYFYSAKENSLISKNGEILYVCNNAENIPEGVSTIAEGTFEGRDDIKTVKLPSTLKIIRNSAFKNCTSIEEVIIPKNVTQIDRYAFSGCTSLSSLVFEDQSQCKTIEEYSFYKTAIKEVILPKSLQELNQSAFSLCQKLTTLTILSTNTNNIYIPTVNCNAIETVYYGGSINNWNEIEKKTPVEWRRYAPKITVICTDGTTTYN